MFWETVSLKSAYKYELRIIFYPKIVQDFFGTKIDFLCPEKTPELFPPQDFYLCPGLNHMFKPLKPLSLFIGLNAQLEIMNNQILGRNLFYMIFRNKSCWFSGDM